MYIYKIKIWGSINIYQIFKGYINNIYQFSHKTLDKLYFLLSVTIFPVLYFYLFNPSTGLWCFSVSVLMLKQISYLDEWALPELIYFDALAPLCSNNENCCLLIGTAVNSSEKGDFTRWFIDYTKWFQNWFHDK